MIRVGVIGYGYWGPNLVRNFYANKNAKDVPLYHLVFASKHRRGSDFWDKIIQKSSTGQLRMI